MAARSSTVVRSQPAPATRRLVELPIEYAQRVVIERIEPDIDAGRFAIKRTIGERVDVAADIFADGHDVIAAMLRDRHDAAAIEAATEGRVETIESSAG